MILPFTKMRFLNSKDVFTILLFVHSITAGPLIPENSELDLLTFTTDPNNDASVEFFQNLPQEMLNSENLDSNSDDIRLHKRHHHHHHHHHRHHEQELDSLKNETKNVPVRISPIADYGQMCHDGQISDQSEVTWKNSNCETCHCENRRVSCHSDPCPDLPCKEAVRVENECCPVCPEKICEAVDGRKFNDGSKWHLDDCTFCECSKGRVLCSVEDCEFKSCANPVKVPGQCCPVCPDSSCHEIDGSNHTAGAVWKEGECTHCYCRKGEKVCGQEKCPHINCSEPYRRPGDCCYRCPDAVECVVSDWGTWGECPIQECGGGMRRRYRSAVISPRNGGSFCPHLSEAQMCPRLPCNELPVCPVTAWSSWSHCTATCGAGHRMRTRKKTKVTKATMTSLIDCSTTHMQETVRCYAGTCTLHLPLEEPEPDNDHCFNAVWSEWGPCSVACGKGTQTREQRLDENATQAEGHLCPLLRESRQCHSHNCSGSPNNPVHCKVTHWSPWTPCSASCGSNAAKSKHRTIQRHPSPEGKSCPHLVMTRPCRLPPCEVQMPSILSSDECVSDDGLHHYAENERWDPAECLSCICINSKKVCHPMACSNSECDNPIKIPGFCCLFCLP